MTEANYPADWEKKYTDPALRARQKDEVVAGDKGGKPGQWSARKAQLLKAEYEKAGGGYRGKKDATQQHLSQWSQEDWQTSDGNADARTGSPDEKGGASRRYLPREAWEHLSEEERRATDARKAEGSRRSKQFVPNPEAAARAAREAREHRADGELPIDDYDSLDARAAAKAVGGLANPEDVRSILEHERAHAQRKTVLERAARKLG